MAASAFLHYNDGSNLVKEICFLEFSCESKPDFISYRFIR